MGEYYSWVNIDKKEYICPVDFDLGNRLHETASVGNELLGSLYSLLSLEWKGDRIVFLGDETEITANDVNPVLRALSSQRKEWNEPGYDHDYVTETYRCISGIFKASEKEVRPEIEWMIQHNDFERGNYYRAKQETPFEGLFARDSRFFRFTINHTKHEFFDVENTKLTYLDDDGVLSIRVNPLPLLMAFPGENDKCTGLWLGDEIEVTDNTPPADYRDMSNEYGWDYSA